MEGRNGDEKSCYGNDAKSDEPLNRKVVLRIEVGDADGNAKGKGDEKKGDFAPVDAPDFPIHGAKLGREKGDSRK
jgi:hypothetical protein